MLYAGLCIQLEQVVTGGQLQQVAVLVQGTEKIALYSGPDELDGQTVGSGAVDLDAVIGLQLKVKGQLLPVSTLKCGDFWPGASRSAWP